MRDTFIRSFTEHAKSDQRLMLITGDLGFGVLTDFSKNFPKQYINAGVAEQNMTGLATGLALEGRTVFTYSIGNFPTLRCLEQIRNDAAYHDARVNVVSIGGGFSYGALGMSHHATEDLAIMRSIPQITVLAPGCMWEVKRATTALVNNPGTGFLRLDKSSAGDTSDMDPNFVLGEPRHLIHGSDVTIATAGGILGEVLDSANELSEKGIHCDVFSCHTIKPFQPLKILASVARTGVLVIVEEHVVSGGLAGLLAEECMEGGIVPTKFIRMGIRGGFCSTVGSQAFLREKFGLDKASIVKKILSL